eukprot:TRINITY_DN13553_c0_g1_i6.p2 TRINITY_DN13553_c0_g1~~TRINITY_DN13553_c0_g1_i6.p2  ORF type:complete len:115 (+),score=20.56 TRINITY_DN13553_c0_g1_i6:547-891(+)
MDSVKWNFVHNLGCQQSKQIKLPPKCIFLDKSAQQEMLATFDGEGAAIEVSPNCTIGAYVSCKAFFNSSIFCCRIASLASTFNTSVGYLIEWRHLSQNVPSAAIQLCIVDEMII